MEQVERFSRYSGNCKKSIKSSSFQNWYLKNKKMPISHLEMCSFISETVLFHTSSNSMIICLHLPKPKHKAKMSLQMALFSKQVELAPLLRKSIFLK